jgi:hypothetical protein
MKKRRKLHLNVHLSGHTGQFGSHTGQPGGSYDEPAGLGLCRLKFTRQYGGIAGQSGVSGGQRLFGHVSRS